MYKLFLVYLILFVNCLFVGLSTQSEKNYGDITYPFQQYIQVRKTYSIQHLPKYTEEENVHSSSYPSGEIIESAASIHGNMKNPVPKLKEEIQTWGKQEVYEEKGYTDSDYDHYKPGQGDDQHGFHYGHSTNSYPQYKTLADTDGSSTKLLHHAATVLYDRDAHQHGIYKARSGIYCPPVINFDLSSKSMAIGKGHTRQPGKSRLSGLGSKIQCLRRKYFGDNPFPTTIFKQPEHSKKSLIIGGSMEEFILDMNKKIRPG